MEIERRSFQTDRISRRSMQSFLKSSNAAVLVAEDHDVVIGYAVILFRERARVARLYSIAALPRRRGTGATLLRAAEAVSMIGLCCRTMRLEVREDNRAAIAMYLSTGYKRTKFLPDYYSDGVGGWRLEKALTG